MDSQNGQQVDINISEECVADWIDEGYHRNVCYILIVKDKRGEMYVLYNSRDKKTGLPCYDQDKWREFLTKEVKLQIIYEIKV